MNKITRIRKLLLVLPLLVIPFLTLAFWALGGGKGKKDNTAATSGLNLSLPGARHQEEKLLDKLSFYEKAQQDSLQLSTWKRSDPYLGLDTNPALRFSPELEAIGTLTSGKYNQHLTTTAFEATRNNPEDQLLKRLKMLEETINKPVGEELIEPGVDNYRREIERLEPLHAAPAKEDPEIKQLEGTLDKILDIQHPQRVKERSLQNKGAVYAVRKDSGADTVVNGFFSYSDQQEYEPAAPPAIEAVIAANQTIVNGAVIKFRLLHDVFINGHLVPKDVMIAGIVRLDGERLLVEINSIRYRKSIYPVQLEVYDMDGLPGIYIPGTINRDVAKESLNNSLSLADMTAVDPSLKAHATATGVGAIKSLVSRKAKLVRVQVKVGYKVLFHNKNQF